MTSEKKAPGTSGGPAEGNRNSSILFPENILVNIPSGISEVERLALEAIRRAKEIGDKAGVLTALKSIDLPEALERFWNMPLPVPECHQNAQKGHVRPSLPVTCNSIIRQKERPWKPLEALLEAGASLIGRYESKAAIASGDDYRQAFTQDLEEIKALWNGQGDRKGRAKGTPIHLWAFEPGAIGFICLDLDRNHSSGGDGVEALLNLLAKEGVILPGYLKDLDGGSHPCYVTTPSGGLHLYFKSTPGTRYSHSFLEGLRTVELFHYGNLLTAPGSRKKGGEYVLHGSLGQAPLFPSFLARIIARQEEAKKKTQRAYIPERNHASPPPLEMIAQWTEKDGHGGTRNPLSYGIARRASKWYTPEQVEDFLNNFPLTRGHSQIKDAVKSGFMGR